MNTRVVVVGAGIQGLAHALAAAERGCEVTLVERDPRAVGASVRNFGMVWPIGMATGLAREAALRSREIWLQAAQGAGFAVAPVGALFLATREDEWAVLEEFCRRAPQMDIDVALLSRQETVARSPVARADTVLGSLFSPTELNVNPREAIGVMPRWLREGLGVKLRFGEAVKSIRSGEVILASDTRLRADRIIVCPGDDLRTLFPEVLLGAGIVRCKLQMLSTAPMPGLDLGPMIASGLSLRHYPCFADCSGLATLKARIAAEQPELDRFGIHVMASQFQRPGGGLILGDSHQYEDVDSPFDDTRIHQLILDELRRMLCLPHWQIAETWHGTYAKHPERLMVLEQPEPEVWISVAPGGAGMTLSFGLADCFWRSPDALVARLTPARNL